MPQPPQSTKKTIHGVEVTQITLQGKLYTPVDGRVKIAEQADPHLVRREGAGYHVAHVEILTIGDRYAYHCLVEYPAGSGVMKPGTDFIDLKDPAGIAKAETSAIGRALGLHGIAVEESVSSAEEIESALAHQTTQATTQAAAAANTQQTEWEPSADAEFCRRLRAVGITTQGQFKAFLDESAEIHGKSAQSRAYALLAQKERLAAQPVAHDLRTHGPAVGREGVRS